MDKSKASRKGGKATMAKFMVKIFLPENKQRKSRSVTRNKAIDAKASPETGSIAG